MDEQTRLLELLIGQLDKRLTSIDQHMAGFHAELVATRTELKGEMAQLRTELKDDMTQLRTEFKGEMAQLRSELKGEMAQLAGDLRGEMRQMRGEMEGLRAEGRTHLRWSLAGMFVLFGAAGPLWMWVLSRILK